MTGSKFSYTGGQSTTRNSSAYNPNYKGSYSRTQVADKRKTKHSGCTKSTYTPTEGANKGVLQVIVNGWMAHRGKPMLKFTAVTTSKSKLSEKGWLGSVAVTVINMETMQKQFYWGCMEKNTGKVVIADLGLVMNPKGGYKGVIAPFGRR